MFGSWSFWKKSEKNEKIHDGLSGTVAERLVDDEEYRLRHDRYEQKVLEEIEQTQALINSIENLTKDDQSSFISKVTKISVEALLFIKGGTAGASAVAGKKIGELEQAAKVNKKATVITKDLYSKLEGKKNFIEKHNKEKEEAEEIRRRRRAAGTILAIEQTPPIVEENQNLSWRPPCQLL